MLRLEITIPELYDELKGEFIAPKVQQVDFEHSLISLSKWESKWNVPFLATKDLSVDQVIDYVRCMAITKNVDSKTYDYITAEQYTKLKNYIHSEMTATKIPSQPKSGRKEIVTSELIYYWMISLNIPFECQKWHLNRLLTLINVCNIKNSPPKKVNKHEIAKRNAELNAMRKQSLGTQG